MKTKKILSIALVIVLLVCVLPVTAITISAFNTPNDIAKVELTVPVPKAGEPVNIANNSVTPGAPMEYEVIGVHWFKDNETDYFNDRLCIDGNESDFVGNHNYTVRVDLRVKGDRTWNVEYINGEPDYSHISATVNGNAATVEAKAINGTKETISVVYKFPTLEMGVVSTPIVIIPTPLAGMTPADITATVSKHLQIPSTGFKWNKASGNSWVDMEDTDRFIAGADYRLKLTLEIADSNSMHFGVSAGDSVSGYINGKRTEFEATSDYAITCYYDVLNVKPTEIQSVAFDNVASFKPSQGQKPLYTAPAVDGTGYEIVTSDAITGGAEYGYVNGIRWSCGLDILNEKSLFVYGKSYTLSFMIQTDEAHHFDEWLDAHSDIGYIEAVTIPGVPTLAEIFITFPPCEGGTMTDINIGGVEEPMTGKTPDYDFVYGIGFEPYGDIVWYDINEDRPISDTETFIYGHNYALLIILKADSADGGSLSFGALSELNVKINGKAVDAVEKYEEYPEKDYVAALISYECQKTPIAHQNLSVETPIENNTPAEQIRLYTDLLMVYGLTWTKIDPNTPVNYGEVFDPTLNYFLTVTLAVKDGYIFDPNHTEIVINGQAAHVIDMSDYTITVITSFVPEERPFFIINFDSGIGTGDPIDPITTKGGNIILPECNFTAPEGYVLIGWSVDGISVVSGNTYNVTENVAFTAMYAPIEAHEHILPEGYTNFNELEHWKECMVEGCESIGVERFEVHNHNYDSDCDAFCNDCGWERTKTNAGDPLHFYQSACSEYCPNCGASRDVEHTPGKEADCTNDQTCTVCGKVLAEALGHSTDSEANCGYSQICTVCGTVLVEASGQHTPGAAATCTAAQICTVCNKELSPAKGHTAGAEWIGDENGHYRLCADCGSECERASHTDSKKVCETCGYKLKKGLGAGAIVAIVLGSIAVAGGAGFCVYWFIIRKKKQ